MGLFGGGNSIFNKPFGTGSGSVGTNPLNILPIVSYSNTRKEQEKDAARKESAASAKGKTEAMAALEEGERKGEILTGSTSAEVGEGRSEVRDRLQDILQGDSAGSAAMKQDQAQAKKQLRSEQALSGGGQMDAGQAQALERQSAIDIAKFQSSEKRQALSDLSREFRGAGSDIMKSSGQHGAISVGMIPPAQPKADKGGIVTQLFGGFF